MTMTDRENNIFQTLAKSGIIGAAMSYLLLKKKERQTSSRSLAGAAILATYEANQVARQSNIPVYVEENGKLYAMGEKGQKSFIKDLPKPINNLSKKFKLV
jgi:hypothetical protein